MNNTYPFRTTTKRGDQWTNRIDAPYTKQSYLKNPGPGHYQGKKKGEDVKSRLLMEESIKIPFGATDERDCNKNGKMQGPGPGTYIDINNPNHSSICKSLNKIKEDRTLAES